MAHPVRRPARPRAPAPAPPRPRARADRRRRLPGRGGGRTGGGARYRRRRPGLHPPDPGMAMEGRATSRRVHTRRAPAGGRRGLGRRRLRAPDPGSTVGVDVGHFQPPRRPDGAVPSGCGRRAGGGGIGHRAGAPGAPPGAALPDLPPLLPAQRSPRGQRRTGLPPPGGTVRGFSRAHELRTHT